MYKLRFVLIAVFAITLAACATNPNEQSSRYGSGGGAGNGSTQSNGANGAGGMNTSVLNNGEQSGSGGQGMSPNAQSGPLSEHTFYFAFDSSDVAQKYMPALAAHAQYLINHSNAHVRLEGNTDERGTREYNLALGERRAEAVKQVLTLKGVPASQVTTVSYGEEKPAETGHNEAAWAKSRRVELVYTNQG